MNTFGSTRCKREECDVLSVTLQGISGEDIRVQVLSYPIICSALRTPVAINQYSYLYDLDLADVNVNGDQSNILIGSDYYKHVDIIHGQNGFWQH